MLVLAFDVGGVYIKSGLVELVEESAPVVIRTTRRPFAFRSHAEDLEEALAAELRAHMGGVDVPIVVFTVTAETVGVFPTIAQGMLRIGRACAACFPDAIVRFLSVHGTLDPLATVERMPLEFASANWAATSAMAADTIRNGLFIDIGSTTTDIIPIVGGAVRPSATTDLGRLMSGELVYAGMERTYLPCITARLPLRDQYVPMAAEIRAFTAHVYVLLDWLDELMMLHPVLGQPLIVDRQTSLEAMARSVCADPSLVSMDEAIRMAEFVRERQITLTYDACHRIIANTWPAATPLEFVIAGSGHRIAEAVVRRLDAGPVVTSRAFSPDPANATAVALARLASADARRLDPGSGRGRSL